MAKSTSKGKSPDRSGSVEMRSKSKTNSNPMLTPHAFNHSEVLKAYNVNIDEGLSDKKVETQRAKYGTNELAHEEGKSIFALILEQFDDLLVKILLGAALVSFILALVDDKKGEHGEGIMAYIEPIVILIILFLNAAVGVWQETNAEGALEALKKLQPELAHVKRNGEWVVVNSKELVPGDVVEVSVGGKVPADLRVVKLLTTTLMIEQSQLTGESQSVSKDADSMCPENVEIQGKSNMLFSSTTVSNGKAIAVVTNTGMTTEIGKIQSAVQDAGKEEEDTPLSKKLDEFGTQLSYAIGAICLVVWLINIGHFSDPVHGGSWVRGGIYYFKIAVALAVAAIPEGLPAVITTCLALGTRKMAQRNAIVRKLPSVETLGCTTVICSDKTGTLTTNEMCVVKFALFGGKKKGQMIEYDVEGVSYAPIGAISNGFKSISANDKAFQKFATVCAVCNQSRLSIDKDDPSKFVRTGEPTEAAIRVLVEKMGCPDETVNKRCLQAKKRKSKDAQAFSDYWESDLKTIATLEFSRDRKSMSVLVREAGRKDNSLFVKGAPENILERCSNFMLPNGDLVPLEEEEKVRLLEKYVTPMANDALRTLAVAVRLDWHGQNEMAQYDGQSSSQKKTAKYLSDPDNFVKVEDDLVLLGFLGLQDPPRPECKGAIEACRQAGISVVMITGDNKKTAEAIAKQLGIVEPTISSTDLRKKSFTGQEFETLTDRERFDVLRGTDGAVFSRTEPRHKQIIVKILKELGEITAMTGDGVNDAPALKQADIGIAMGISGTEVAKEASDMVLVDDNFATIVSAVEEGRSIYNNMKAFIRYLISSNIGEVASIFFTAALGIPEGLAPVQLLWVNLVTDGLPATALGFNPPDLDVMDKPPRRKDDSLISRWVFFRYCVIGIYVGLATVGIFVYWYVFDQSSPDHHTLVSLDQLMNWGKCKSWKGFRPLPVEGMTQGDPCSYFTTGKTKASTLSLTVLVVIEMFNALNALSEDGSLLQIPPWANPWLILAIMGSIIVHFIVIYTPFLAKVFAVTSLDWHEWQLVLWFSFPVVVIDEILKMVGRRIHRRRQAMSKRN